jgi:hypothetical protein
MVSDPQDCIATGGETVTASCCDTIVPELHSFLPGTCAGDPPCEMCDPARMVTLHWCACPPMMCFTPRSSASSFGGCAAIDGGDDSGDDGMTVDASAE